jgi:hypothetical protein
MSTRETQKRLISRIRRSVVATSVAGALGIAGYLGISTHPATASDAGSDSSTDGSTTPADGSTFADQHGGSTEVGTGSGNSHATSSGS